MRVNVNMIASRAALVFGLPLVCRQGGHVVRGAAYPDDPANRCQAHTTKSGSFRWRRESDGKSVACLSLDCSYGGYRLDFHRRGESGVSSHPLGDRRMSASELCDALHAAESALQFLSKKVRP